MIKENKSKNSKVIYKRKRNLCHLGLKLCRHVFRDIRANANKNPKTCPAAKFFLGKKQKLFACILSKFEIG